MVDTCTLAGYNMKDFDKSLLVKINKEIGFPIDDLIFVKFGTPFRVTLLPIYANGDETLPLWSSDIKGSTITWLVKGATYGALPG